jgi:hypothetical protein
MRGRWAWVLVLISSAALAAPGNHAVAFGKWTTVKWSADAADATPVEMKVRPLFVDGRLREYTLGEAHEVTDRVLVVQQAYRANDALPGEHGPLWKWQRGTWLVVERATGRVRHISLPDFDSARSQVSWYRDCGASEEDGKLYGVVMQLGRRKPLLRKELGPVRAGGMGCASAWQRAPARVTFSLGSEVTIFEVRGHAADPAPEEQPKADENP